MSVGPKLGKIFLLFPPQFKVPVFDPENFYPGLKLAIDKAISLAGEDTK